MTMQRDEPGRLGRITGRLGRGRRSLPLAVVACATAAGLAGVGLSFAGTPPQAPLTAEGLRTADVPVAHLPYVRKAATRCRAATAPLVAAQAEVNAGWRPGASTAGGGLGLGAFSRSTWREFAVDGDGDGDRDPLSAADALVAQADYLCWLDRYLRRSGIRGDRLTLVLAAYRVGPGTVRRAGGVPAGGAASEYVAQVRAALAAYAVSGPDREERLPSEAQL